MDKKPVNQEDVIDMAEKLLTEALQNGWLTLPVYNVWVSANGQVMAIRCELTSGMELDATVICSHSDDEMQPPINLYFSDGQGKAVRAFLSVDSGPEWIN